MIDFKGYFQWGPFVANYKIEDDTVKELLKRGRKEKASSANKRLAGLLTDQRLYSEDTMQYFIKWFEPYYQDYISRNVNYATGQKYDKSIHSSSFSLIELWVNFMKEKEYNPVHTHSGHLSWVIFLKTPNLDEEYKNFEGTGHGPGVLSFFYGENSEWAISSYKYKPVVGEMWIFPAKVKHGVVPYSTKGERISVSGNLFLNPPNITSSSILKKPSNEI